jgi:ATP-dependent helicase HepA
VREVDGRFLRIEFPEAACELRMAAEASGLQPLRIPRGARALLMAGAQTSGDDEPVVVADWTPTGYRLADGREVAEEQLWPLALVRTPLERLGALELDPPESFRNRIAGLRLREVREAGGLGSFLGGRIELFPHQLFTALQATRRDPVRWLLADEVGLGKTIEACLILSALVRTRRAERALIVAPQTLTIQWLGELYRKFHQIFVLLDGPRRESVARDIGPEANPFEIHPLSVISLEDLAADPELTRLAQQAGLDLLAVDEVHRLAAPRAAQAVAPLARAARHVLLLSAVPLHADIGGFHGLLDLLHPGAFGDLEAFRADVEAGRAALPCTSAVRRADLGGLPPRVAQPVDVADPGGDLALDPRTRWLIAQVQTWVESGQKALVFVSDRAQLERLQTLLETATRTRVTAFHEGLSPQARDIQVARFRETRAPLLLCSEAGSEGRNFQFCDRIVHFDLPDDPVVLEQRIGRLDRIGRTQPVQVVYFRHTSQQPDLARLYERLDLFTRPSAGLDAALGGVQNAVRTARAQGTALDTAALEQAVAQARGSAARAAPHVLYSDAYQVARGAEILARVPPDLEPKTREFCVGAAEELGFTVVGKGGRAQYFIELAHEGRVDSLPGVPGGARYLGSFDREEAIRREEIDFFASGHPLVEGLLLELEDGPRGRATAFTLPAVQAGFRGAALLVAREAAGRSELVLVDAEGQPRPEWVPALLEALPLAAALDPERLEALGASPQWSERIRELGARAAGPNATVTAAAWILAR